MFKKRRSLSGFASTGELELFFFDLFDCASNAHAVSLCIITKFRLILCRANCLVEVARGRVTSHVQIDDSDGQR